MQNGILYLIPVVLHEEALHVIPHYVHEITKEIDVFFVENEKTARRYLRKTGFTKSFDEVIMFPVNEHTNKNEFGNYISHLLQGKNCGLMSEAGLPAVADPGSELVKLCHEKNISVVPLSGPSSVFLALMASGLNGQKFVFHGYLPIKTHERNKYIQKMNSEALKGTTQIFIETPYRNNTVVKDILENCSDAVSFCIASELTGKKEFVCTKTVSEWRKHTPHLDKVPAVFLIG